MKRVNLAPKINVGLLAVLGLQLLSMIDGLTTYAGISLGVGVEMNPYYFPLLAAKTLGLSLSAYVMLDRKPGEKLVFAVAAFGVTLGFLWLTVIANNLGVLLK